MYKTSPKCVRTRGAFTRKNVTALISVLHDDAMFSTYSMSEQTVVKLLGYTFDFPKRSSVNNFRRRSNSREIVVYAAYTCNPFVYRFEYRVRARRMSTKQKRIYCEH